MIRGVRKIVLPVDDQDRAKDFWVDRIGFTAVQDATYEGGRWLEVSPPDGSMPLVLSPRGANDPRRNVDESLPHSDVFFTCDDILQTHHELTERGVRFHTPPTRMPFGWWAMFDDADGTRYVLQQD